jgi:hypothetical protein
MIREMANRVAKLFDLGRERRVIIFCVRIGSILGM